MGKTRRHGPGAPPLDNNVAAMRALAHPLRLRIIELLAESARSVTEIAERLEQPRTRLYHHVKALERAGLLRLTDTRKHHGNVERWYQTVSRPQEAAESPAAGAKSRASQRSAKRAVAMAALEQLRQDLLPALSASSPTDEPLMARLVGTTSASRIPEMQKRLLEFFKELKRTFDLEDRETKDAVDWMMTVALVPAGRKKSTRRGRVRRKARH